MQLVGVSHCETQTGLVAVTTQQGGLDKSASLMPPIPGVLRSLQEGRPFPSAEDRSCCQ